MCLYRGSYWRSIDDSYVSRCNYFPRPLGVHYATFPLNIIPYKDAFLNLGVCAHGITLDVCTARFPHGITVNKFGLRPVSISIGETPPGLARVVRWFHNHDICFNTANHSVLGAPGVSNITAPMPLNLIRWRRSTCHSTMIHQFP